MMTKLSPILLLCLIGLHCSQPVKTEQPAENTEIIPSLDRSGTGLSGMFQVENIEQWMTVYNREVNKSVQIGMLQNLDDPKLVFNLMWTDSHEQGRELIQSSQTQSVLTEGSIQSEPQFTLYDVSRYFTGEITDSLRLAITLEALNYDMWKSDFDRDESSREKAGLTLIGMATQVDNKNLISVLFSCSDKQTAYDFLSSPNMKKLLTDSGVIGEPNMTWWRVINQ